MAAANDLDALDRGETADLGRAGAGRECRIQAVDVEAQIDRPLTHMLAYFVHQRRQ